MAEEDVDPIFGPSGLGRLPSNVAKEETSSSQQSSSQQSSSQQSSNNPVIPAGAIYELLRQAGFDKGQAEIMVAIAYGESTFDTTSLNMKGGDNSYGLFQINMIDWLGPAREKIYSSEEFRETYNLDGEWETLGYDTLFDPRWNIAAAHHTFVEAVGMAKTREAGYETGYDPWTVYRNGSYKSNLYRGKEASATNHRDGDGSDSSGSQFNLNKIYDPISSSTEFDPTYQPITFPNTESANPDDYYTEGNDFTLVENNDDINETTQNNSGLFVDIPEEATELLEEALRGEAGDFSDISFLEEQFGAIGFWMNQERENLLVGINENGVAIPFDPNDPSMTSSMSLIEYAEQESIQGDTPIGETRLAALVLFTTWGQTNNKHQRAFDIYYAKLNNAEQNEYLDPVIKNIEQALKTLGYSEENEAGFLTYTGLYPNQIKQLAVKIERLNKSQDINYINNIVNAEVNHQQMQNEYNDFEASVEEKISSASDYYVKVNDAVAREWAEDIFVGNRTEDEWVQFLKHRAYADYPHLEEPLMQLNMTPKQYFASTEMSIEDLLGEEINLSDSKWSPIMNHTDENTGAIRSMATWEAENWVRSQDDYLRSNKGQNKMYQLVNTIATAFGKA